MSNIPPFYKKEFIGNTEATYYGNGIIEMEYYCKDDFIKVFLELKDLEEMVKRARDLVDQCDEYKNPLI